MEKILILNGSPRAPKSNSRKYAELFMKRCVVPAEYYFITRKNHLELCKAMEDFHKVLLVFPLYADGIPVTLLDFLKTLEKNPPKQKPEVSVLINCGFIEPEQNDTAVSMVRCFCRLNGYEFGSLLRVGSGEAILNTPFKVFAVWKINKLAASISSGKKISMKVTMPITKKMFLKASSAYWENYGKRNGITKEQMCAMEIES